MYQLIHPGRPCVPEATQPPSACSVEGIPVPSHPNETRHAQYHRIRVGIILRALRAGTTTLNDSNVALACREADCGRQLTDNPIFNELIALVLTSSASSELPSTPYAESPHRQILPISA